MPQECPLSETFRPHSFEEVVGQRNALSFIQGLKKPLSMIFWGPPGCGKTTLAKLLAKHFSCPFVSLSAVFSGVGDLKKIIENAKATPLFHQKTLLFVDEIHRFNKAQQDAFLPFLEDGTLVLVGATTENPSFYLNQALLSRVRVLELSSLDEKALLSLIENYEAKKGVQFETEIKEHLVAISGGDGRYLFNLIENLENAEQPLTLQSVETLLHRRPSLYDRGDQHYNLISALHKTVRASDVQGSLYWFARMLEGGEEPLFLARRLIRMATEDVGLADPEALKLAIAAKEAYEMLGSPEGELALAEVVVYLALSPKSNAIYEAYNQARSLAAKTHSLPPPKHLLNAPTKMMKEMEYGKGYKYDHHCPDAFSGQATFPEKLPPATLYTPKERGFERDLKKRIDYFERLKKERAS